MINTSAQRKKAMQTLRDILWGKFAANLDDLFREKYADLVQLDSYTWFLDDMHEEFNDAWLELHWEIWLT